MSAESAEMTAPATVYHLPPAALDALMRTQVQLAELRGMLSERMAADSARLLALETAVAIHERRLDDKKAGLATANAEIITLRRDLGDAEARISGAESAAAQRGTKLLATAAALIGVISTGLALFNRLAIIDPGSLHP